MMSPIPHPPASSADDSQRHVKRRTSRPKTKTGCKNCKQRRIKCDEKRPSCTQCVRSRKICTGYPPPARARPHEEIRIAPKPPAPVGPSITPIREPVHLPPRRPPRATRQPTPPQTPVLERSSVVLYDNPCPVQSFDLLEGQYFQLFRSCTANELSGYFDNVFWTTTVLRECHTETAIKHAVVALGALYKTLEKGTESPPGSPSDNMNPMNTAYRHWEAAVKQYSKACHALVVVSSQDQKSHRTRLMASVLLACFDSFIGDHKQAIVQIQNGLGFLEKLRAERRRAFIPKPEEPVEDELIQMFTRLAIQAKSYDMAFHFPEPFIIHLLPAKINSSSPPSDAGSPVSIHQEPIPPRFSSLREARIAWDTLCEQVLRAMESMMQYANSPPNLLPESMMTYGQAFAARFQSWSDAFDHILVSRTAPGVSSQEKAGIAVLKMNQIMGHILYLMTFSNTEMQFDRFQAHFQAIVDLALEVVGDEERRAVEKRCPDRRFCQHHGANNPDIFGGHEYAARHIKPSFSADLGIVPPLYVVATKSRNPVIRRKAIQLLKSSARREGMWDSEMTAEIGSWVMEIEEEEEDDNILTPDQSPGPASTYYGPSTSRPTTANTPPQTQGGSSVDFGELPLGPGGNARWDARRGSTASSSLLGMMQQQQRRVIPPEKRVLLKSAEFNLRERTAFLKCGTRGLARGAVDARLRETHITW